MDYQAINYTVNDAVATITLNRPEAYNALDGTMGKEFFEASIEADEDTRVRCIVVTGAGGKAFCAGGDVKGFHEAGKRAGVAIKRLTTYLHGALSRLARTPKPVVMAVNGVAAGAGMSIALAADIAVATESAKFDLAYARIAATPDGSSSYYLPRIVGLRRALELHYLDRSLSAHEALDWGIVNRVYPDAEFAASVAALVRKLADGPTLSYGRGKLLFLHSLQESLETQMELEAQAIAESSRTEDFMNAVAAFTGKKTPVYRGR